MHVNSVYKNKGQQFNREFTFNVLDEVQPKDGNPTLLEHAESSLTVISLNGYKPKFKDKTALSTLQIAKDVIEHCLPFLSTRIFRPLY